MVLFFAAAAIVIHAVMPSPGAEMDPSVFDSLLVKKFGFPAVASGYFVVLFLHIFITIKVFAEKSDVGKWKTGCFFGLAFALLYMGGMQEVMVSASPLTEYGLDFVRYEFFLGLGDALPAFLLYIVLCILHCAASADVPDKKVFCEKNFIRIMSISSAFFAWRLFGYITGIVDNEMEFYPAPVLAWTFVFGIIAGIAYCLIDHTLPQEACRPKENVLRNNQGNVCPDERTKKRKMIRFFAIIGVNWIWFNCYIGLIAAHTFWVMVLRAGADVLALVIGGFFAERIIEKG